MFIYFVTFWIISNIILDTTLAQHKRLLQPDLHSFMNVTLTIEGEKEKVYTLRNVIEKRLPSLFNTDALIKKKREKKGDAGIVSSSQQFPTV